METTDKDSSTLGIDTLEQIDKKLLVPKKEGSEIIETETNFIEFEIFDSPNAETESLPDNNNIYDDDDDDDEDVVDRIFDAATRGKAKDLSKLIFSSYNTRSKTLSSPKKKKGACNFPLKRKAAVSRTGPPRKHLRSDPDFKDILNQNNCKEQKASEENKSPGSFIPLVLPKKKNIHILPKKQENIHVEDSSKLIVPPIPSVLSPKLVSLLKGHDGQPVVNILNTHIPAPFPLPQYLSVPSVPSVSPQLSTFYPLPTLTQQLPGLVSPNTKQTGDDNPTVACNQSVDSNPTVACNQSVDSNPTVACNQSVDSNPTVTCNQSVDSNPTVACNQSVDSNSTVACNQSVDSNPTVACNQSVDSNPTVVCNQSVESNPTVAGYQSVDSNAKGACNQSVDSNAAGACNQSVDSNPRGACNQSVDSNAAGACNQSEKGNPTGTCNTQPKPVFDFSVLTNALTELIENRVNLKENTDVKLVLFCNDKPLKSFSILKTFDDEGNVESTAKETTKEHKFDVESTAQGTTKKNKLGIETSARETTKEHTLDVETTAKETTNKHKLDEANEGTTDQLNVKPPEIKSAKIVDNSKTVAKSDEKLVKSEVDLCDENKNESNQAGPELSEETENRTDVVDIKIEPLEGETDSQIAHSEDLIQDKLIKSSESEIPDSNSGNDENSDVTVSEKGKSDEKTGEDDLQEDVTHLKTVGGEISTLGVDRLTSEKHTSGVDIVTTEERALKPSGSIVGTVSSSSPSTTGTCNEPDKHTDTVNDDEEDPGEGKLVIFETEPGEEEEETNTHLDVDPLTGYIPYDCDICNKSFQFRHHLNSHKSRLHADVYNKQSKRKILEDLQKTIETTIEEHNQTALDEFLSEQIKKQRIDITDIDDKPVSHSEEHFINLLINKESGITNIQTEPLDKDIKIPEFKFGGTATYNKIGNLQNLARIEKQGEFPNLEPVFVCEHCGKFYRARKSLKEHFTREHATGDGQEPLYIFIDKDSYICTLCFKSFPDPYRLVAHCRDHTKDKDCKCVLCGRAYSSVYSLRRHIDSVHHDIRPRPFKCNLCDYAAANRWHLTEHQRRHTGDRPFQCPVCSKSFSHQGTMNRHCKVIHKVAPGEPKRLFYPEGVDNLPCVSVTKKHNPDDTSYRKRSAPSKIYQVDEAECNTLANTLPKFVSFIPVGTGENGKVQLKPVPVSLPDPGEGTQELDYTEGEAIEGGQPDPFIVIKQEPVDEF